MVNVHSKWGSTVTVAFWILKQQFLTNRVRIVYNNIMYYYCIILKQILPFLHFIERSYRVEYTKLNITCAGVRIHRSNYDWVYRKL